VLSTGQVVWSGGGRIGGRDGWVTLWPADIVLTPPPGEATRGDDPAVIEIWQRLADGGAWRVADLGTDISAVQEALWHLAWGGLATCDTFTPVRSVLQGAWTGSIASARSAPALRHPRAPLPRRAGLLRASRPYQPALAGRWSAVQASTTDATTRWTEGAALALTRHGILTRGAIMAEPMAPSFMPTYNVLKAMEDRGLVRRGFFVEGAGASQFALPGAVDRLRETPPDETTILAACDPANPYGAAIDWPTSRGHRPARRAGAIVALRAGVPICYLERGARTLLTFEGAGDDALTAALVAVGAAVDAGRFSPVTITRIDQQAAMADSVRVPLLRKAGFSPTPQGFIRRPG